MHFIVLKENINKVLSAISRNISSKVQLPILSNILLKTDSGQLKISTTNLELGMNFTIPAKIEKEGEITVPGKLLADFVANLTTDKIEFILEEKNLIVKTTKTHASFTTIPASDFPPFPEFNTQKKIVFPYKKLKEAISRVVFAASTDETRPILTGVKMVTKVGKTTLSATDGYRLSIEQVETPNNEDINLIIPARTLSEIVRISGDVKADEVGFSLIENKNQAIFFFPEVLIFTRLIDGEFPNIEKIIPTSFKTKITIDKEILAQAVRSASLFARGAANIIKIKVNKNELQLSANTPQVGQDLETLEAKIEGEETEIAFNFRFLLDLLSNFPEESLIMEISGPLNPGVIKPVSTNISFLHIIMPVRVQG